MADDNCNDSGPVKKVEQYKPKGKTITLKASENSKSVLKDLSTYIIGDMKSGNVCIVFYDIFGFNKRNKNVFQFCDLLQSNKKSNYSVIMPDFFRNNNWSLDEMGDKMDKQKFNKWWLSTADFNYVIDDMNERIIPYLNKNNIKNITLVGLCWGGLISFLLSGNEISKLFNGCISIHGARIDDEKCNNLKIPLLYAPAKNDYDADKVKKILDNKPFGKQCVYSPYLDQIHGFCAARGDYNDKNNRNAIDDVLNKSKLFIDKLLDSENKDEQKNDDEKSTKIVVIGGNGTIGSCVVTAIKNYSKKFNKNIKILIGGRGNININNIDYGINLSNSKSILNFFKNCSNIDHIIICAGESAFGDFKLMNREKVVNAYQSKVFGQMEICSYATKYLNNGGSVTLTSGYTANYGMIQGSSMAGAQNAAIHAFVKATPIDIDRNIRINCVCPGLLSESEKKYGSYFIGLKPIDGKDVALAYLRSMFGGIRGKVLYTDAGTNCKEI